MTDTVLVTGGTGFIGAAVAAALARAGYHVRAGARRSFPSTEGAVAAVPCDLDKRDEIDAAVVQAVAVVHCAYGDEAAMARQCASLLEAMSVAGVGRLVYFSSIAVYGDAAAPDVRTPLDRLAPVGVYAGGKVECERMIQDWAKADTTRRAIVLRPGIVYGKGSRFWVDKLAQRIRAGIWGDFGPLADAPAPLIHVDDVARAAGAAVRLMESTSHPIETLDLVGPETPTWNHYFHRLAAAVSQEPLPRVGPARLAWWRVCATPAKVWRKLGLPGGERLALAPSTGELRLFSRRAIYDRSRAETILGTTFTIGVEDGIARAFGAQETCPDP